VKHFRRIKEFYLSPLFLFYILAMHEKIFIIFMVTSLTYMMISLRLVKVLLPQGPVTEQDKRSVYYKKMFFTLSVASTVGLIIFFLKHRLLCHDLAFSWFAFCEYLIAFSNMGFHYTTTMVDFPQHLDLLVKNTDIDLIDDNDQMHKKKE
jgi:post-GPI attachment to proteins factor 2